MGSRYLPLSLMENVDKLLELLASPRAGLITDVDGTISPIAPTPEEADLLPEARSALARLVPHLRLVAAVSGRQARQVAEMVGVPGMAYVGNHGLDWLEGGQPRTSPEAAALPAGPVVLPLPPPGGAGRHPAVLRVEDKGATASLHYRACPDPARARRRLLEAVRDCPESARLQVTEGRMVVNLRPPVAADKGTAVERLARAGGSGRGGVPGRRRDRPGRLPHAGEAPDSGGFRTATVAVASEEAPAELLREADYLAEGVAEVAAFLQAGGGLPGSAVSPHTLPKVPTGAPVCLDRPALPSVE